MENTAYLAKSKKNGQLFRKFEEHNSGYTEISFHALVPIDSPFRATFFDELDIERFKEKEFAKQFKNHKKSEVEFVKVTLTC